MDKANALRNDSRRHGSEIRPPAATPGEDACQGAHCCPPTSGSPHRISDGAHPLI